MEKLSRRLYLRRLLAISELQRAGLVVRIGGRVPNRIKSRHLAQRLLPRIRVRSNPESTSSMDHGRLRSVSRGDKMRGKIEAAWTQGIWESSHALVTRMVVVDIVGSLDPVALYAVA